MGVEGAMVMFMFTTSFTPPPTGYTDSSPSKLNWPLEPSGVTVPSLSVPPNQTAELTFLPSKALRVWKSASV